MGGVVWLFGVCGLIGLWWFVLTHVWGLVAFVVLAVAVLFVLLRLENVR